MAANCGRLAERIARVLGQTRPEPLTFSAPGAASALLLAITAYVMFGQTADRPKFDVASVKPIAEKMRNSAGMPRLPGGRLHAQNVPVRALIMRAYQLQGFQIVGGPSWLGDVGFDVEAKGAPDATNDQVMLMLQSLLEERFQLKYHREMRELPVFALTVAKNGPKLPAPKEGGCKKVDGSTPPSSPEDPPCGSMFTSAKPAGMSQRGGDVSMESFIANLSSILGRPVLDRTGVTTHFDLRLEFAVDEMLQGFAREYGTVAGHREMMAELTAQANAPGASPNIVVALREQLGLKLDSTKGPVEVMVIDHVEKPGAN